MATTPSSQASRLVREMREEAGLTQSELAERVRTTQSVISRLESDDYEGHSLSMLYRVGRALRKTIRVTATGADGTVVSVMERPPAYGAAAERGHAGGLTAAELDALEERLVQRFGERGVTRAEVAEVIRESREGGAGDLVARLRGAIAAGRGDVVADVRRARRLRGRPEARRR